MVAKDLQDIRRRLSRRMVRVDKAGFQFESCFGPPSKSTWEVAARVRVELQPPEDCRLAFRVCVDIRNLSGATADEAADFSVWLAKAVRKAKWAQNLTEGKSWSTDEVLDRDAQ